MEAIVFLNSYIWVFHSVCNLQVVHLGCMTYFLHVRDVLQDLVKKQITEGNLWC